jgi:hypothetical protein
MKRKLRRLLIANLALIAVLVAYSAEPASAAPMGCLDVEPFCNTHCECSGTTCAESCDFGTMMCPTSYEVWCNPE